MHPAAAPEAVPAPSTPTAATRRGVRLGQVVALGAGLAQVASGFLAWTATGASGLDVQLSAGPRIGVAMVVLAGLPLVALLVTDRGWPRVVSGLLTGVLVVAHLRTGPDGALATGVVVATWAAVAHLLAAALATGRLDDLVRVRLR